jgi:hypothetical protein
MFAFRPFPCRRLLKHADSFEKTRCGHLGCEDNKEAAEEREGD